MNIVNYVVGCLLWLPTFFALCVDNLSVLFVGLLWGLFLWNSPKISLKAKRFWRQFHKTNFQILNLSNNKNMNKFYYFMQVLVITICSTCALMVAVSMLCGCSSKANNTATVGARLYNIATPDTISDVVNDTDAKQLKVCESLLNECAKCGILDAKDIQAYNELKTKKSVSAYIELITECECEENFYDTVGSGDTWCCYVWYILEPRGLAE